MDTQYLLELAQLCKESGNNWQERRQPQWTENYTLYRNNIFEDRLLQRQTVNIPLMKSAIKTNLKDIDEAPMLKFHNNNNDLQKEVFYNAVWEQSTKDNKLVVKDIIDKKQALLYGRTFKKQQIINGRHWWNVIKPLHMKIDRYADPSNLDSARFMVETNIFQPLSSLEHNPDYDQQAIKELKEFYATEAGLLKAEDNENTYEVNQEEMRQMGVDDISSPVLGETYVELWDCFVKIYNADMDWDEIWYIVVADNSKVLLAKTQEEVVGETGDHYWRDHFIYTSWAEDPEATDIWSDAVADTLRPLNNILNVHFSQGEENRTLKNFNMNYYDATDDANGTFVPQTFIPTAWGWYPINGNPREKVMPIPVQDLSDGMDEMNFVLTIAKEASAATNAQQGSVEKNNVTLGEVQLALANAKDRVKAMIPLYTSAWEEFGLKYTKLLEAAQNKMGEIKVTKMGKEGKRMYQRYISPEDWYEDMGYSCEVKDISQSADQDMNALQILQAARNVMPNNKPLDKIYKRKILELNHVMNADEIKEVMDFEEQQLAMMASMNNMGGMLGAGGQPTPTPAPQLTAGQPVPAAA